MDVLKAALSRLKAIPNLTLSAEAPLAPYTRFGIGGRAALICDTVEARAFLEALSVVEQVGAAHLVIGGGTNLVVSDAGFDGIVLRFSGAGLERHGELLRVQAGAVLQDVVDASIGLGLRGMESMTGIPGFLGGAVYGNAGAYGHSMEERVETVTIASVGRVRKLSNHECRFGYRESIFKERKDWVILSADLRFDAGDAYELAEAARKIRVIRDEKYPPTMKCAGSIFKNVFLAALPVRIRPEVPPDKVREGKVPSAWFLEQVNAKGLRRGDIQVAAYHANLIYNDGAGTAADLVAVIEELKARVRARFGFDLEEEVQYVGFEYANA